VALYGKYNRTLTFSRDYREEEEEEEPLLLFLYSGCIR
jgi:hypothetical protein